LGTGLFLGQHHKTERDIVPWRKTGLPPGETVWERLKILPPCLHPHLRRRSIAVAEPKTDHGALPAEGWRLSCHS